MLEVTFDQIVGVVSSVVITLTAAVGFMAKWILSEVSDLKNKLVACEEKHVENDKQLKSIIEKAAKLEGKVEEMERMNPTNLVSQITEAVSSILKETPNAKD